VRDEVNNVIVFPNLVFRPARIPEHVRVPQLDGFCHFTPWMGGDGLGRSVARPFQQHDDNTSKRFASAEACAFCGVLVLVLQPNLTAVSLHSREFRNVRTTEE
jgi:hypothetical protein